MTDQMLKDAFERLADRAEPVDGLAERALRRAGRRRAAGFSGVVLGTAAAVAAPMVFLGGASNVEPDPALAAVGGLPANSAADHEIVRACLRPISARGSSASAQARLVKPTDFRLLVSYRVGGETVAMVGSKRGFVLCVPGKEGNMVSSAFRLWLGDTKQGPWTFAGDGRVDGINSPLRTMPPAVGKPRSGQRHLIAGRVKPGIVRVVINRERGRKVEAAVRNGFFIGYVESTLIKKTDPTKRAASRTDRSYEPGTEMRLGRILSVEGYDSAGRASLFTKWPSKGIDLSLFDSTDCLFDPRQENTKVICAGFVPQPG